MKCKTLSKTRKAKLHLGIIIVFMKKVQTRKMLKKCGKANVSNGRNGFLCFFNGKHLMSVKIEEITYFLYNFSNTKSFLPL